MSVWAGHFADHPTLAGHQGELVSLRLTVEPRLLEELLESLAGLPFPVNPQIQHKFGDKPEAVVEFPAYQDQLKEVCAGLARSGFPPSTMSVKPMLEQIHAD